VRGGAQHVKLCWAWCRRRARPFEAPFVPQGKQGKHACPYEGVMLMSGAVRATHTQEVPLYQFAMTRTFASPWRGFCCLMGARTRSPGIAI